MTGLAEQADAVAAAQAHLDAVGGRPLRPLPDDFGSSRLSLHRIAEHLLKPKRELETGNEIALRFTPGGFGTPPWEAGEASGTSGQIRVEGTEVVVSEGSSTRRVEVGDLRAAAERVGIETAGIETGRGLEVDPDAATALTDWFAFGTVVLARLIDRFRNAEPEPIRLWPEHFDVATVLGAEAAGARANYGASPGDDEHPEPYLYVGPWLAQSGEAWNASAFPGAELGYGELLEADDQLAAGLDFMVQRALALGTR